MALFGGLTPNVRFTDQNGQSPSLAYVSNAWNAYSTPALLKVLARVGGEEGLEHRSRKNGCPGHPLVGLIRAC